MTALKVVAGIIENEEGQVLLAQRPPNKALAGLWEFPGGKIEAGETPVGALKRELREELELDVRTVKDFGSFTHIYDWGAIELHVWQVRALNLPRPTEQVQVFRWVNPVEISALELAAADRLPLAAFLKSRA